MALPDYTPTIPAMIADWTRRWGDSEFVVTDERRLTYREADEKSAELARGMLATGVGKGTRVGILMPNGPDWAVTWLAASRIGALAVPISTFYQARELRWILRHSDIERLYAYPSMLSHDYVSRLEQALPELSDATDTELRLASAPYLREIRIWGGCDRAWAKDGAEDLCAAGAAVPAIDDAFLREVEDCVTPADLAVVIYSSGSTAEPKGAMHTHGTVVRHGYGLTEFRDMLPTDRIYSQMPMFWVGGLITGLLAIANTGGVCLAEEGFVPDRTLAFLERERATSVGGWPAVIQALAEHPRLHDYDLSSVRSGNLYAVMPPELHVADPELRSNSLGMTETCGPHTWGDMTVDLPEKLRGSFGRAVPGVEHKVVDPDTGETLPQGELGELCVRGYSLMQGMYKRERADVFDADGFYHTGDSGYFDAEGHLFFKGRLGELIKTAGANVVPREVELVLESFDDVKLAAVVGIPDPVREQLVVAAIVPEDGCSPDPEELRTRLKSELSSYKVPRRITVSNLAEIPLTSSGKVHKQELAAKLAGA